MLLPNPRRHVLPLIAAIVAACHQAQGPDLPVVEMRPANAGAPLAVIVSGDGGWRAIDKKIARGLHRRGYAVVGLNARQYFARRRSPEESAMALEAILRHYGAAWKTKDAIAVGYSRGAGVLPFMINRLPADLRGTISLVALIGLDRTIDFYVTPFDLVRTDENAQEIPVHDEVMKLHDSAKVLCIFGAHDEQNACGDFSDAVVVHVREPGGHHMKVSRDVLAGTIADYAAGKQKAEGRKQK